MHSRVSAIITVPLVTADLLSGLAAPYRVSLSGITALVMVLGLLGKLLDADQQAAWYSLGWLWFALLFGEICAVYVRDRLIRLLREMLLSISKQHGVLQQGSSFLSLFMNCLHDLLANCHVFQYSISEADEHLSMGCFGMALFFYPCS